MNDYLILELRENIKMHAGFEGGLSFFKIKT